MRSRVGGAVLVLVAGFLPALAAHPADELVEQARAAFAEGGDKAVRKLVAARRAFAYEAIAQLVGKGEGVSLQLARTVAAAYAETLGDARPLRWVESHERSSPEHRAGFQEALSLKRSAGDDQNEGRLQAAEEKLARCVEIAQRLSDAFLEGRCLANLAGVLSLEQKAEDSLRHLNQARETVVRSGDRMLAPSTAISRAWVLTDFGKLDDAAASFEEAYALYRSLGDVGGEAVAQNGLGVTFLGQGNLEKAARAEREAILLARRAGEPDTEVVARMNLGRVYQMQERFGPARRVLEEGVALARQRSFSMEELEILRALIVLLHDRHEREAARAALERARALSAGMDSPLHVGRVEVLAALLHLQNEEYADALAVVDAALPRIRSIKASISESDALSIKAQALYALGEYDEAVAAQRASLEAAEAAGRNDALAEGRKQLGDMLVGIGDIPRGLEELDRAVATWRSMGDEAQTCRFRAMVGGVRLSAGERDQGRAEMESALLCLDGHDWATAKLDLIADAVPSSRETAPALLEDLARVRAIYEREKNTRGLVQVALLEAKEQIALSDPASARSALRRVAQVASRKLTPDQQWTHDHLEGLSYSVEGDRPRALRAAERALSKVEALRGSSGDEETRAAVIESRMEPYRELVRLRLAGGEVTRAYETARLAKARTFSERFASPRAARLDPLPAEGLGPVSGLQALLRPGELVVDYFLLEAEAVAFLIRRDSISAKTIRVAPARLRELARIARYPGRPTPVETSVTSAWNHVLAQLGEILLEPIAAELASAAHVMVVPTGPLVDVPFAAITLGDGPLFGSSSVAVLPSVEVLRARSRASANRGAILAFGDPELADASARLPGAAKEVRRVAENAGPDAVLVLGSDATEAAFLERAPDARIIHLAAHGRVDPRAPWSSRIDLAPAAGRDGRLTAEEISALRLSADLVVLSGCATGRDIGLIRDEAPGDERQGLVRAFLAAGVHSVIASLWEIDDEASAAILPALYAHGAADDPAAALAHVQVELREGRLLSPDGRRLDHPFYWAALTVYGAGR